MLRQLFARWRTSPPHGSSDLFTAFHRSALVSEVIIPSARAYNSRKACHALFLRLLGLSLFQELIDRVVQLLDGFGIVFLHGVDNTMLNMILQNEAAC